MALIKLGDVDFRQVIKIHARGFTLQFHEHMKPAPVAALFWR